MTFATVEYQNITFQIGAYAYLFYQIPSNARKASKAGLSRLGAGDGSVGCGREAVRLAMAPASAPAPAPAPAPAMVLNY